MNARRAWRMVSLVTLAIYQGDATADAPCRLCGPQSCNATPMNSRPRVVPSCGSSSRQLRSQQVFRHHVTELQRAHGLLVDETREDVLALPEIGRASCRAQV